MTKKLIKELEGFIRDKGEYNTHFIISKKEAKQIVSFYRKVKTKPEQMLGCGGEGEWEMSADYTPFGDEWTTGMMKLRKRDLIEMFKVACQEREELQSQLSASPKLDDTEKKLNESIFRLWSPSDNHRF